MRGFIYKVGGMANKLGATVPWDVMSAAQRGMWYFSNVEQTTTV